MGVGGGVQRVCGLSKLNSVKGKIKKLNKKKNRPETGGRGRVCVMSGWGQGRAGLGPAGLGA